MKTIVYSTKCYEPAQFNACNNLAKHELVFSEEAFQPKTAGLASGAGAISISIHDRIDSQTMQKLAAMGIRAIALRCAGFENVDLESAAEHNIKVVRVPAYSPQSVAEHAVALIMALTRKTNRAYNKTRNNDFSLEHLAGFTVYGKTVGVIGTGKIGTAFCKIMLGFGCKVVAFDIVESEELKGSGVSYVSFDVLLRSSDIISLHCPLTDETYHLFNRESYNKMKPGSMLINTARGAVISTLDTLSALKNGHLGYLGIDVYEWESGIFHVDWSEGIVKDDFLQILLSYSNVVVTPHQAFFTAEAIIQICQTTIDNLTELQNGHSLTNEVKAEEHTAFHKQ